jgi:hypothetical protein
MKQIWPLVLERGAHLVLTKWEPLEYKIQTEHFHCEANYVARGKISGGDELAPRPLCTCGRAFLVVLHLEEETDAARRHTVADAITRTSRGALLMSSDATNRLG